MKIKVSAVAFMAFFVLVASASAFHWHLGYGQAKHATKEFAEALRQIRNATGGEWERATAVPKAGSTV